MVFGLVGLTEVDGTFTLGSVTDPTGDALVGSTLGGVLLVMMLVRSWSVLMCIYRCVESWFSWADVSWRAS